ncbi:MAG: alpha-amylase family glycosyl hydrolase [Actinomycetota bacterium]|nr:alpha-amylase family glycosyl hydrolase [Actinomycetota bacterium]
MADEQDRWWKEGVLYQVYPRSYADSNADGVGDLPGIVDRLDHLAWLGIDGIWLNPVTVSPDADWGYDVADFTGVQPVLGTLDDVDALIAAAAHRKIKVMLDLVPNHTSIRHAWFEESRSSRDNPKRDWYVWADPKPDGSPPNNWTSGFADSTWTLDDTTGQYYLHNFLPAQPDLNWWNEEVRDEFDRILRFWFDRGVAGFRIDVVHMIVKDKLLRDNPPATKDDHWMVQVTGQRQIYNGNRPEVHDVIRRWRSIADSYDTPRILVGETHVFDTDTMLAFYGQGDELHLAFNFLLVHSRFEPDSMREIVESTLGRIPAGSWPVWTGGNHDVYRFPSRWCEGDASKLRGALMMLLTLPGSVFLYYGDELGMPDTDVPKERLEDPVGKRLYPVYGRDPERTPMQWSPAPGAGFTEPGVEPWLPFGDSVGCNVEDQRRDPESMLSLCRDLIGLRAAVPDLRTGAYARLAAEGGLWAWRRGERTVVALNLGDDPAELQVPNGMVRIATQRERDGERVEGALTLGPWEGAIVWLDEAPT